MSSLEAAARKALKNRRDAEAAEQAAKLAENSRVGVERAKASPLGEWFPGVEWEWVADLSDGTTLVREKGDTMLLGFTPTSVSVWRDLPQERGYGKVCAIESAADLGAYIEDTTPQQAGRGAKP